VTLLIAILSAMGGATLAGLLMAALSSRSYEKGRHDALGLPDDHTTW